MKRTHKIFLTTAVAAGLAAVAIGATAAPGYGKGDCAMGDGAQNGEHPRGERMGGRHQRGDATARLTELREKLAITDAQAPAWDAFAAKVSAKQDSRQARREQMRTQWEANSDATPAERMERRVEMMGARLAEMTDMAASLKTLYAELTPEQQAIFAEHGPGQRFGKQGGGPRHGEGHHGDGGGHQRMERRSF